MAFMSYEILAGQSCTPGRFAPLRAGNLQQQTPIHTAIQDLESFFWVLVYLCLTRCGPGGARRTEIDSSGPASETLSNLKFKNLHSAIWCLFNSNDERTITNSKEELFDHPELFSDLQALFHPYFDPLKPLLTEWWQLLRDCYATYDDIGQGIVHDRHITLLNKWIESPVIVNAPQSDEALELKAKEIVRRKGAMAIYNTSASLSEDQLPQESVLEFQTSPAAARYGQGPASQRPTEQPSSPQSPSTRREFKKQKRDGAPGLSSGDEDEEDAPEASMFDIQPLRYQL